MSAPSRRRKCATFFELMRGDRARRVERRRTRAPHARARADRRGERSARFWRVVASGVGGAPGGGSRTCVAASNFCANRTFLIFDGLIKIALAEAEARAGDVDRALAILDEALATAERIGHRSFDAELHRARGEMLLKRDPANPAPAEAAF